MCMRMYKYIMYNYIVYKYIVCNHTMFTEIWRRQFLRSASRLLQKHPIKILNTHPWQPETEDSFGRGSRGHQQQQQ